MEIAHKINITTIIQDKIFNKAKNMLFNLFIFFKAIKKLKALFSLLAPSPSTLTMLVKLTLNKVFMKRAKRGFLQGSGRKEQTLFSLPQFRVLFFKNLVYLVQQAATQLHQGFKLVLTLLKITIDNIKIRHCSLLRHSKLVVIRHPFKNIPSMSKDLREQKFGSFILRLVARVTEPVNRNSPYFQFKEKPHNFTPWGSLAQLPKQGAKLYGQSKGLKRIFNVNSIIANTNYLSIAPVNNFI